MRSVLGEAGIGEDTRWRAIFRAGVCALAAAVCACGSASHGGGPQDSGAPPPDGGSAPDASDGGPDCGSIAPVGTQIVAAAKQLVVKGLTFDSKYALYVDTGAQSVWAVPVAGGSPVMLGPYKTISLVPTQTGAFFFPTVSSATALGPLLAWAPPGASATTISMSASAAAGASMSDDGSLIAYFASMDGTTGTLTVSTVDGKTQTPLLPGVDLRNCPADAQFDGTTLLAAYCLASAADGGGASDAGAPPGETVATFTGASFTKAIVGTTFDPSQFTYYIPVDSTGMQLLLTDSSGLGLYPVAGGPSKLVDANGGGGGLFAPNGDLVYPTATGSINRWTAASGTTTALVASGAYYPLALSFDGTSLQLGLNFDQGSGASDIYLASATMAGTPASEWSMTTAFAVGYTTDSKYELFETGATTFQATTFDLHASAVSGGAESKIATIAGAGLLDGSRIVVTDDYMPTGTTDIEVIDLANPAAKKTLVTQADVNLQVTATDQIVYSWYCQLNSMAGIWVAPAP
jgi:hypothetical protein